MSHNYWDNFTIDDYAKDLIPAAASLGIEQVFVDNLNKSSMSELRGAPATTATCAARTSTSRPRASAGQRAATLRRRLPGRGHRPYAWTNNAQAYSSPLGPSSPRTADWWVRMEDTRLAYGGAYTNVLAVWSFRRDEPRTTGSTRSRRSRRTRDLDGYLFDSFYNLAFMPVDYADCRPTTQWRQLLGAIKELQDAGVRFLIESFGPFGQTQHGCPSRTTWRTSSPATRSASAPARRRSRRTPPDASTGEQHAATAARLYRVLAHMTDVHIPLFVNGERHRPPLGRRPPPGAARLQAQPPHMHRRFLQEDGQSVLWHDEAGRVATLWNFADREAALPGDVRDVTTGRDFPRTRSTRCANHTYTVAAADLPKTLIAP